MSTTTPKRLGAIAIAAMFVLGACSSSGSSSAPASAAPESAAPASAPAESAPASAAASASAAAMAPPAPSADNVTLQGSGATFPAPLYDSWFQTYTEANPQVQFDYQAIGSGGGIKAITDGTVDFGASDAAMKDEEIAALPADCKVLHIPTALGAVVVIYNLPGVASVNLDADNVAGIYLGTIKKWNDPAIAANNPGRHAAGHRHPRRPSLGRLGHDERVHDVPRHGVARLAHQGRQGQGSQLADRRRRPGQRRRRRRCQADARRRRLRRAQLRDHDRPDLGEHQERRRAVRAGLDRRRHGRRRSRRWPTSRPTSGRRRSSTAPVRRPTRSRPTPTCSSAPTRRTRRRRQDLVAFTYWALTDGQALENGLGYAPLPAAVQQKSIDELHKITSGGAPVWP